MSRVYKGGVWIVNWPAIRGEPKWRGPVFSPAEGGGRKAGDALRIKLRNPAPSRLYSPGVAGSARKGDGENGKEGKGSSRSDQTPREIPLERNHGCHRFARMGKEDGVASCYPWESVQSVVRPVVVAINNAGQRDHGKQGMKKERARRSTAQSQHSHFSVFLFPSFPFSLPGTETTHTFLNFMPMGPATARTHHRNSLGLMVGLRGPVPPYSPRATKKPPPVGAAVLVSSRATSRNIASRGRWAVGDD
jgi:hypothetical protein